MPLTSASQFFAFALRQRRFEIGLAAVFCLTLVTLFFPKHWLDHSYVIEPSRFVNVYTVTDAANGGSSTATVTDYQGYSWQCELIKDFIHPYCSFEIRLGERHEDGVDLGQFDRVRIWLDYAGPTQMLRLNLRNFDPALDIPNPDNRLKYNYLEFPARMANGAPIEFSLQDLAVPEWWLQANQLPPHESRVELDRVSIFELSATSHSLPGLHQFTLSRIEFWGRYISTERLYEWVLVLWLMLIASYVGYRSLLLSRQLRQQRQRERELMDINQRLDSRSRQLDLKAKTDPLTGLLNRHGLEDALQLALAEQESRGAPLSLILFDIDYFKRINDAKGHLLGDSVLTQMAQLVRQQIRRHDTLARWGGEEFVLLCQDTNAQAASLLAEKIRLSIATTAFAHGEVVTASFGVAQLLPNQSLNELFSQADTALYAAKHRGRNCVVTAR